MLTFQIFTVAIFVIFEITDVSSVKCYECEEGECVPGPGKEVDCGPEAICGVDIDVTGYYGSAGGIKERYCIRTKEKPHSCVAGGAPVANMVVEHCACEGDLCNIKPPNCSKRAFIHHEVRKLLAEECKKEIEVFDVEDAKERADYDAQVG